jgi:hypothetical protein
MLTEDEASFTGRGTCHTVYRHCPMHADDLWRNHSTLSSYKSDKRGCTQLQDVQISNIECCFKINLLRLILRKEILIFYCLVSRGFGFVCTEESQNVYANMQ